MVAALVKELLGRAPLTPAASRNLSRALVALALLFLVFLLANLFSFGYGRDQGIYGVVGEAILHGKAPYRDAWDFKPPAIFFVFALSRALLGGAPHAIRMLEAACWATVPLCFARILSVRGGDARIGVAAGVLATYVEVRTEYWHTAQPESFAAVCLVWALTLVTRPPRWAPSRGDAWAWAGAGALFSIAGLLKPPLGGGLLLLLPVWFREHRAEIPRGRRASRFGLYAASTLGGAALPVAATLAYFASKGALPDLVETLFGFAPHYTKLGTSPGQLPQNFLRATGELFAYFSPLLVAALLVPTPLVPRSLRLQVGLGSVVATAFFPWVGVALQGKFFPYHYEGSLPFVCLLATVTYAALLSRLARAGVPRLATGGACAMVVLGFLFLGPYINPESHFWPRVLPRIHALLYPSTRVTIQDSLMNEGDTRAAENRRLSDWLRAATPADASVFVWGFEPVVYLSSERRPASRFVYDVPQRVPWSREAMCAKLERDLAMDPPAAVAVEHDDRFADVTGDRVDSSESLSKCEWLPQWLAGGFTKEWSSPKFDAYLRRDLAARSAEP